MKKIVWVIRGQKIIIYALLISVFAIVCQELDLKMAGSLIGVASYAIAVLGVIFIGFGLEKSLLTNAFLVIFIFIPIINLIALFIINLLATKALRTAGYKVGFFGVSSKNGFFKSY